MSVQKIQEVVEDFIAQNKMFTSVDIANEVKKRGTWVSTMKDVSPFLHMNVGSLSNGDYNAEIIKVVHESKGTLVDATLYHHFTDSPSSYDATNQHAIIPAEFDAMHPNAGTITLPAPSASATDPNAVSTTALSAPAAPAVDPDPSGLKAAASVFQKFNFPKN